MSNEKDKKEVQVVEMKPLSTTIDEAVAKGADLDKLEKLLELQIRWEQNEAKKEYVKAMAAFKLDPPEIEKDRHVKFSTSKGVTEYRHASLANVTDKINAGLSEHGLSAAWVTKQDNGNITVACKITHILGHSEETVLTASPDLSGSKNPIQAIGSAISYLQRYTLLSLTGLATHDMDDDGNGAGSEPAYITEAQKTALENERSLRKVDGPRLLKQLRIESLDKLPGKRFAEAMATIRAKPLPKAEPKAKKEQTPGKDDGEWMDGQEEII